MIDKFLNWCVDHRVTIIGGVILATLALGYSASRVEIKTVFSDLLPQDHPYIGVHNRYKDTYGGSNIVSVMVEVTEGDILNHETLATIQKVNNQLSRVPGADPFQVTSIASKKLKNIKSSTQGIETSPLMWPDLPKDAEGIDQLKEAIKNNSLVYGRYVAEDFTSALITVGFFDHLVEYETVFEEINKIVTEHDSATVNLRVVGEPALYGLVISYLTETALIFAIALLFLVVLLSLIARTWHGTLIPIVGATISFVWAVGFAGLLGYNLDPLIVVVAFLITATAVSNSVQVVTRFDSKHREGLTPVDAAKATLRELFRPAMLAVTTGAGCVLVVTLTPIPLLEKVAVIAAFWSLAIGICGVILPAILASWLKEPGRHIRNLPNLEPVLRKVLNLCARAATTRWRYAVAIIGLAVFIISGLNATNVTVGDANPGSSILNPNSTYNKDAKRINETFQGSDRMYVVMAGEERNTVKEPEVLTDMLEFQRYMEAQPEIGGSVSLADVLPRINQVLHEGNPRYHEVGATARMNGEFTYMFVSGSDPGDIQRFAAEDYTDASIRLFFRDRQGDTIRSAIARIEQYAEKYEEGDVKMLLAGGLIGVLAAVNEVILAGQISAIALALLVLVVIVSIGYRSLVAGMLFMVPVVLSNTLTFSYMTIKGIGININTLPVVALGIGLGVDYSIYVVDSIREKMGSQGDLQRAIAEALGGAGLGVLTTVITLVGGVSLWLFSSLRLQSEMGALIATWLTISASSSLLLMPALIYIFKPAFIVGRHQVDEEGPSSQTDIKGSVVEPSA